MDKGHTDAFSNLNSISNFIFFSAEIILIIFVTNPILQVISFLSAIFYAFFLFGSKTFLKLAQCLPLAILSAILNPLFSHEGATIIGYWYSGNPITKESVYYGMGMGIMVLAMLMWFIILNRIMTVDKWIHLFGRIFPNIALLFSMVMRFLPKLRRRYREMKLANPDKNAFELFSMLITWGLEVSVDTADSMSARGYGVCGRSSYTIYHFRMADAYFITVSLVLAGFVFWDIFSGRLVFYYYPVLAVTGEKGFMQFGYVCFLLFSMLPFILEIKEVCKWSFLQSKI